MIGKIGSRSSLKYNFKTPATELMSDASVVSANGSSPRSNHSRKLLISTCDPDTRKMPWWWSPYKLITRIQLRIINGMSSPVASKYSSSEPPNSFGRPDMFIRPIRLLQVKHNQPSGGVFKPTFNLPLGCVRFHCNTAVQCRFFSQSASQKLCLWVQSSDSWCTKYVLTDFLIKNKF